MEYKVSVIVPVYNAEEYLNECIDSLINQTISPLEIILLNDGSKDNSGKICDEYAEKYDNIVVRHLENGGPSRARNIGLSIARGEFVGFVDSDDFVKENMFELLYNEIQKNNSDMVISSISIFDGKNITNQNMDYEKFYIGTDIKEKLHKRYYSIEHSGLYSVWNKMFKMDIIKQNNLCFDEELIRA